MAKLKTSSGEVDLDIEKSKEEEKLAKLREEFLKITSSTSTQDEQEAKSIKEMEDRVEALYEKKADRTEWLKLADTLGRSIAQFGLAKAGQAAGVAIDPSVLGKPADYEPALTRQGKEYERGMSEARDLKSDLLKASEKRKTSELFPIKEQMETSKSRLSDISKAGLKSEQQDFARLRPTGTLAKHPTTGEPSIVYTYNDREVFDIHTPVPPGVRRYYPSELGSIPGRRTTEAQTEEGFDYSPDQRKYIKEIEKQVDPARKDYNKAILASNQIIKAIEANDKMTPAQLRALLPRLQGEVGNLAQYEQVPYEGVAELLTSAERFLNKYTDQSITLTDVDTQAFSDLITRTRDGIVSAREDITNMYVTRLVDDGIPEGIARRRLGMGVAVGKSKEETAPTQVKITPTQQTVTPSEEEIASAMSANPGLSKDQIIFLLKKRKGAK